MALAAMKPTTQNSTAVTYSGTRSNLAYKLGQEVGSGGNGVVYAVSRRPELVAKIQKQALSRHDVDKLNVLVQAVTPELLAVAAWPMDALRASNGQIVGFVMPRIHDARPLYELYSPRSRVQHFAAADFRFLVHTAANVARLFAAVHKAGFICGDVNHSNILVRQTGTVAVVDCDSFQVGDGSRFPCGVGTDLFVPPELMGVALGGTRRTVNHDNFGLAVLIFHLLFMGRHPFAGRFLGRGEMPIEQAIAQSRFAYSLDRARTQLEPPPFTPPMTTVGTLMAALFEQAFAPAARHGGRPTPEVWIDALEGLKASLSQCKSAAWHYHPASTGSCPWCAIENAGRIKLFGGVVRIATAGIADLESLWARYLALVEPAPSRPVPVLPPKLRRQSQLPSLPSIPTISAIATGSLQRLNSVASRIRLGAVIWVGVIGWAVTNVFWSELSAYVKSAPSTLEGLIHAIAKFGLSSAWVWLTLAGILLVGGLATGLLAALGRAVLRVLLSAPAVPSNRVTARGWRLGRRDAERAWQKAVADWKAFPVPPDVSHLRPPVESLKRQLDALLDERDAAIKALAVPEPEEAQRLRYLASLRIEDAKLAGIGPARCAVLRSWGIDTAADIEDGKISQIPGFGKSLTDKLIIWREMKEKSFVPTKVSIVDPHEVQRIDRRLAARRAGLMKELRDKIADVEAFLSSYLKTREASWSRLETAFQTMLLNR